MSDGDELRDHGLPNMDEVMGPPTVEPCLIPDAHCPNCKCVTIFQITQKVRDHRLAGGEGVGNYLGCPACPWASPMGITAAPLRNKR